MSDERKLYYFGSYSYPFNMILKNGSVIMFTASGFTTDMEDVANELLADIKAGNTMIHALQGPKAIPLPSAPIPQEGDIPPAVLSPSPGRTVPFIIAPKGK